LGNGLVTTNGLPPGPFEIASSSGRFVAATATLVGNTIQVTSSRVSAPTSVRYAFGGPGNVANAVNIQTEGSTTIQTLMTSLFQVDIP
jgi:hypothetical protein